MSDWLMDFFIRWCDYSPRSRMPKPTKVATLLLSVVVAVASLTYSPWFTVKLSQDVGEAVIQLFAWIVLQFLLSLSILCGMASLSARPLLQKVFVGYSALVGIPWILLSCGVGERLLVDWVMLGNALGAVYVLILVMILD